MPALNRVTTYASVPPREIRGGFIWAALLAAILLYYGFFSGPWLEPDTTSWAGRGAWLIILTIKAGGILLCGVALFCLTGHLLALMFEAIASLFIGVGFVVGAALSLTQSTADLLYLVFGAIFLSSGQRNWRQYRDAASVTPSQAVTEPAGRPLPASPPNPGPPRPPLQPPPSRAEPPPEGYLASFADRSEPPVEPPPAKP